MLLSESSEEDSVPSAPPYSPVSTSEVRDPSSADNSHDEDDNESLESRSAEDMQPPTLMDDTTSDARPVDASSESSFQPEWCGFKFVGDNIDKNIRPSFHRLQHQTKSLRHFHRYTVKDRVDLSGLPDADGSPSSIDATDLLITEEEWSRFKDDCCVLVSR